MSRSVFLFLRSGMADTKLSTVNSGLWCACTDIDIKCVDNDNNNDHIIILFMTYRGITNK